MIITKELVGLLQKEGNRVLPICRILNQDIEFKNSCALLISESSSNVTYLSEHVLMRDLIVMFNMYFNLYKGVDKAPIYSKFALIFLYEKLQGRDLCDQYDLQKLNELTASTTFNSNLELILTSSYFPPIEGLEEEFILLSILTKIQKNQLITIGSFLNRVASIIIKVDGIVSVAEDSLLKNIAQKVSQPKTLLDKVQYNEIPDNDSLEIVMSELNELIGLDDVKKTVEDLTNFLKVQKLREEKGLKSSVHSLHSVFIGPPGTGKTTVARMLGRIYKHLGYLKKGHLIETDRAGLVAGYVGQTALKSDEVIKSAIGGVLFIDEAYSLSSDGGINDFGNEAIEILLKRMEDYRKDFVVIVAGYPDEMRDFIQTNPGLHSRFNRYIEFNHFRPEAMMDIFKLYMQKGDFALTEDAENKLAEILERLYDKRHKGFGNARSVRNLFEKIIERQANRIVNTSPIDRDTLVNLIEEDIPEILKAVKDMIMSDDEE